MKAKKSLLAVAAAATVISGLPLPVLAEEQEPVNTPDVNAAPGEATPEVAVETPAVTETKKVSLKFVNKEGQAIDLGLTEEEFEEKYVKETADLNGVEFNLAEISNSEFSIAKDFADANPGIHAEFQEDDKNILKVSFDALENDIEIPVEVVAIESEPVASDTNSDASAGEQTTDTNVDAAADEAKDKAYITVRFVGKDDKEVGAPYTAEYLEGDTAGHSFFLPKVPGYEVKDLPSTGPLAFTFGENGRVSYSFENIQGGTYDYEIRYTPAQNSYKVNYFYQNIEDDDYTLDRTEEKQGLTDDLIDQNLNAPVEGFYALNYSKNERIAADGTTEVNVYYNRKYVLVKFDLAGGYGVEPVYEKYGAPLTVGTPTKAGYGFNGWKDANRDTVQLPATVPANDVAYTADWSADKTSYTVVYWYENADDDGYSYKGSEIISNVTSGSEVSPDQHKNKRFDDYKYFTYDAEKTGTRKETVAGDGTTVVNVYYSRNTYTLNFYSSDSYKKLLYTITAKYEADIADQWPTSAPEVDYFYGWQRKNYNNTLATKRTRLIAELIADSTNNSTTKYYPATDWSASEYQVNYYIESLDGKGTTYNRVVFKLSDKYSQKATFSGNLNYKEIEGLTKFENRPQYDWRTSTYSLYYKRNRHNVKFHNGDATVKVVNDQMFEMPLNMIKDSDGNLIKDFVPELPSTFEKGAYEFGGWYTTPECYKGTEADLDSLTMPDADIEFYAKWIPVVHTITLHQLEAHVGTEQNLGKMENLPHGKSVDAAQHPENPTYGDYEFLGWFYRDAEKEKAFDFNSSVVNQDLNLYAKYRTDILVTATVKYVTMVNGQEVEIADPTEITQLATTNATVNAKGDTELYEGYQEGYFPTTKSTNINFDPDGKLQYTFVYEAKEAVPYTVRYVKKNEDGTLKQMQEPKVVCDNKKAVVTEVAPTINGHIADAYSKLLVVSAEEGAVNEIVFYYTEDAEHAFYTVNHWLDTQTTGPAESRTEQMLKSDKVKPEQKTYEGYELVSVDYDNGSEKVTYTADQWAAETEKEVGDGATFDFHYKAVYYVHYTHLPNVVKRGLVEDINNGGFNTVENVPETHLYAGLFKDPEYETAISDGSENGLGIHASKPGQHYYVKTISRNYMKPSLYAVYNKNSNKIDRMDAFTFIDDDNYNSVSNGHTSFDADVAGNIYDRVSVTERFEDGTSKTTELSAKDFFSNLSADDKIAGDFMTYGNDINEAVATYTLRPYFITKDGLRVDSRLERTYTITDCKFSTIKIDKQTFLGDTVSDPGAVAPRQMRSFAAYQISNDLPEPEQPAEPVQPVDPETPTDPVQPEQPEVPSTITVTKVVNGKEVKAEAEKGDVRGLAAPDEVSGYVFAGWYTDSEYSVPADLTNVQEDITIYGRYISLSEISISAKKSSSRKSTVTAEISCQLDQDVLGDVQLIVEYDGKSIPVSLNKQSVSVGSFFDRLFGKGKKVTEYSGKAVLENVKGSKTMSVTLSWTTADGTEVTGPTKTFTVSTRSIR